MSARLAVLIALLLFGGAAQAQNQQRIYDANGRSLGTVTRDSQGSERFYDSRGRSRGTSSTDSQGNTRLYDSGGRQLGTSSSPRK
jgi:hypothetical protein